MRTYFWRRDGRGGRWVLQEFDITIPYAGAGRAPRLDGEWGATPVPALTLPRRAHGSLRLRMRTNPLDDLVLQDMRSDEVAGHCDWNDRVIVAFQERGRSRMSAGRQVVDVPAGQVRAMRGVSSSWDWATADGTAVTILSLPAAGVRFRGRQRPVAAAGGGPAARMLLAHLRTWAEVTDRLSPAASRAARDVALELFQALLDDHVADDLPAPLVRAAMDWIDGRLLDRDLNPRAVADSLFVSARSLHRAFASEDASVMGYVRGKRLDRARADLTATSLTVSEIAARWHFADGGHFIKAYRKRFGERPGSTRRRG
ncbi:helix-turn-helix transcriptional regulator [Actinoplanes sp. TBRC 11911]|uniref:helix-turn-helix transcriptional regulator n=1 Tax=Actinoplanes sp. TBRC 11911 TaxID=2729386 RepID=UPI00145D93F5|nr:helix-turn-helix transcriptional regulator [Actinoplanes sp. TBRC 11911]NMO55325.1 helix-turn-helix transcriptional regulator [Actinoplanes sp. TBRC 11911]